MRKRAREGRKQEVYIYMAGDRELGLKVRRKGIALQGKGIGKEDWE